MAHEPDQEGRQRGTALVVDVLLAFARKSSWGVRELAGDLEAPKSSVHRTLQELALQGILRSSDGGNGYEHAPGFVRLAVALGHAGAPARLAQPVLEAARDDCGETIILTQFDVRTMKFAAIAAAESRQPIRYIWRTLENWSDLHVGASGKGILAFLPDDLQRQVVDALPDPLDEDRKITKKAFRKDLVDTRRRGYAVSRGERYPGVRAVAAPIWDAFGFVNGDIVIAWPDYANVRDRSAELGELCRRVAGLISQQLGYGEATT